MVFWVFQTKYQWKYYLVVRVCTFVGPVNGEKGGFSEDITIETCFAVPVHGKEYIFGIKTLLFMPIKGCDGHIAPVQLGLMPIREQGEQRKRLFLGIFVPVN